jgi:chromosome segregation ATPase
MTKYHINPRGVAASCSANMRDCPLGAASHAEFDTPREAQAWAENENAKEFGGSFGKTVQGNYSSESSVVSRGILQTQAQKYEERIADWKRNAADARGNLNFLESENAALRTTNIQRNDELDELETINHRLRQDKDLADQKIYSLQNDNVVLVQENDALIQKNRELQQRIDQLESSSRVLRMAKGS